MMAVDGFDFDRLLFDVFRERFRDFFDFEDEDFEEVDSVSKRKIVKPNKKMF